MKLLAVIVFAGLVATFSNVPCEAAPPNECGAVGRFQLIVGEHGLMYVLDTTSGQCWNKVPGGDWVDHGSPMQPEKELAEPSPPPPLPPPPPLALVLPNEKVELTIKQRQSKPIPGSDGRIRLQVDDVSGGQVLIAVRSDDGTVLLDDVSVEQGDIVSFGVGEHRFHIRVKELKNFLTSEDIAVLQIAANRDDLGETREQKAAPDRDPVDESKVKP